MADVYIFNHIYEKGRVSTGKSASYPEALGKTSSSDSQQKINQVDGHCPFVMQGFFQFGPTNKDNFQTLNMFMHSIKGLDHKTANAKVTFFFFT